MMYSNFLRYGLVILVTSCVAQAEQLEYKENVAMVQECGGDSNTVGRPFTGLFYEYMVAPVALGATMCAAGATVALPVLAAMTAVQQQLPVSAGSLLVGSAVAAALTYVGVKATIASYKKMWKSYFPQRMVCKPEDKKLNELGYGIASGIHALQATASFSGGLVFAPVLALCVYDSLMAYWLFENFKKHHAIEEASEAQADEYVTA